MASEIVTRVEARAQGLMRYFTGVPCRAGHLTERLVYGSVCLQCYRDHFAKRRRQHRDQQTGGGLAVGVIIGLKEARAAGLPHYFTGKPCKRGHFAKRHTSNGSCLECDRDKQRVAKWNIHNRDQHNANSRRWRAENLDKSRQIKRISEHKRRAQKLSAGGTHTAADIAEILALQGNRCAYCRADLTKRKKHVDHIMPLALGGSNDRKNIQICCSLCNQSKNSKDPIDYARSLGLLL